jgi:hypothetical protein
MIHTKHGNSKNLENELKIYTDERFRKIVRTLYGGTTLLAALLCYDGVTGNITDYKKSEVEAFGPHQANEIRGSDLEAAITGILTAIGARQYYKFKKEKYYQ